MILSRNWMGKVREVIWGGVVKGISLLKKRQQPSLLLVRPIPFNWIIIPGPLNSFLGKVFQTLLASNSSFLFTNFGHLGVPAPSLIIFWATLIIIPLVFFKESSPIYFFLHSTIWNPNYSSFGWGKFSYFCPWGEFRNFEVGFQFLAKGVPIGGVNS